MPCKFWRGLLFAEKRMHMLLPPPAERSANIATLPGPFRNDSTTGGGGMMKQISFIKKRRLSRQKVKCATLHRPLEP